MLLTMMQKVQLPSRLLLLVSVLFVLVYVFISNAQLPLDNIHCHQGFRSLCTPKMFLARALWQ